MAEENQTPDGGVPDPSNKGSQKPVSPTEDSSIQRVTRLDSKLEETKLDSRIDDNRLKTRIGEARDRVPEKEQEDTRKLYGKKKGPKDSILQDPRAKVVPTPRDYNTTLRIFQTHVVELRFKRRMNIPINRPPGHAKETRRMLCTSNWKFLSHVLTRKLFGWKNPKSRRGVSWYKSRNLLITWDFMKNNFRMISLDDWEILAVTPLVNLWQKGAFIVFYKGYLSSLNRNDRNNFYDG